MDASRALCHAAAAGNLSAIQRTLDGGVDPNDLVLLQASDGEDYGKETTALVRAAGCGQLEATALLLDRAASPDKPDSKCITPVMAAAARGHAAVVGLLAERGADLTAADPNGFTAFHWACYFNKPGCVEALAQASCDMTAKDKGGRTGKMIAEKKGHTGVLECLRNVVAERLGESSWEAALIFWHTISCLS